MDLKTLTKQNSNSNSKSITGILSLPNELLLLVAENLKNTKDLYAFIRTKRCLARTLIPSLHRLACQTDKYSRTALFWAAASQDRILVELILEKSLFLQGRWYANNLYPCWARDSRRSTTNTASFILTQGANLVICEPSAPYSATSDGLNWASEVNHQVLFMFLMQRSINGRIVLSLAGLTLFCFFNCLFFEAFSFSLPHLILKILQAILKALLTITEFLSGSCSSNSLNLLCLWGSLFLCVVGIRILKL